MKITTKITSLAVGVAAISGLALALPAFAQTDSNNAGQRSEADQRHFAPGQPGQVGQLRSGRTGAPNGKDSMMRPGVIGTVASINGTTVTANGHQGFGTSSATVLYTIDASHATINKDNATSTISSIAVGDTISVRGTVTGTNVVAIAIRDGKLNGMGAPGMGNGERGQGNRFGNASSSVPVSPIVGNGQPVVAGTISSISGATVTIKTASNTTFTIDASNAKIFKNNAASTLTALVVGDKVVAQGTVNGSSVVAANVIDQAAPTIPTGGSTENDVNAKPQSRGFFGTIGHFFSGLFGF